MISQETLTYYQAQITTQCRSMPCSELYKTLKKINQPFLDPMAILRTNLSMEASTIYSSDKTKKYLSSFLNLLERNPSIENSLSGASIAKMFFSKLQPPELARAMDDLQVQSKEEATSALLSKIHTRDIALAENMQIGKTASTKIGSDQNQGRPIFLVITADTIKTVM